MFSDAIGSFSKAFQFISQAGLQHPGADSDAQAGNEFGVLYECTSCVGAGQVNERVAQRCLALGIQFIGAGNCSRLRVVFVGCAQRLQLLG